MKKIDREKFHEELAFNKKSDQMKLLQERLRKKYAHILESDPKEFSYIYAREQALKIVEMELDLRMSPFKSLYSNFLAMISKDTFMKNHYIKLNEFGVIEIDEESLNLLRPIKISYDTLGQKS